ncbi:Phenylalanine--tRNA ligase beta subunit [Tepidanaerobacter acetatoxydans Re1]|uniref:Phenylalanine--tRNA ligase beta subunit n=1 Tax=Tepidanaerobacter acetatoxydans (strain DSM 21804 / JCM 16047 / Re1) TaxID=1209989 RepID=F4LW89_TEPAE|nr:phenylalanine--tRNA ligase subunit beta [Tepidanaerobacter acetatoxydans]AEE90865.1 Phenylalanyl-tRNA synthetase beta chain [Tepidanaerobacter acetatoxydans Re1]CCP25428.1 Phenylalanine--tRNA ligase beta subunit [Tepidanaerobacter acetatoxydans Re1]
MLVPISWLKDFVDINEKPEELSKRLTMSGSNVEGIEYWGTDIKNIVIGEIQTVQKHPDADKLVIVYVNTGEETIQIVTGATNIKAGDKVPVALHGSTITGGKKIRTSKLRGIESAGMLCSAEELGLDDHGLPKEMQNGILILPEDAPVGKDIKDYLNLEDVVIDFEITPNRPDCLSIVGVARETAATFKSNFRIPEINLKEEAEDCVKDNVNINIEAEDLCNRYVARLVKDIVIEPSPLWMQRRLQTCGVRSINNIVDITNYVMLEMGQPLHAFDYDKVEGHSIIVRRGKTSEKIETLDGNIREINESMLLITDGKKPLGIAGVMGGADSEITSSTKCVLIESANFFGPNIRRTSKQLGLRSESSMRFEKGIDPNICLQAADRACELIEQLGAGKVLKGYIDVFPGKTAPKEIPFNPDKINSVLGTDIPTNEMVDILNRLEITVNSTADGMKVIVPTFRSDLVEEADIIEEIGRMYGYDRLPITLPTGNVTHGKLSDHQKYINEIKDVLVYNGYSEIYTYSFISPKVFDNINAPQNSSLRQAITLLNPLGEEHSIMRTTLMPNILDVISFNLNHKVDELRFFEIGAAYLPKELPLKELPYENKRIAIGLCDDSMDFYDLKRVIETLFKKLRIKNYNFLQEQHFAFHTSRCAKIVLGNDVIGFAGEINPDVLENYEISKRVYIAELDLDIILSNASGKVGFEPLPKFPTSDRDLAIVVNEKVLVGDVINTIKESAGNLLERVELFDIYQGGQIAKGYKSIAFSLVFRAEDRTLTDTEVNEIIEKITKHLQDKFNATLRE